MVESKSLFFFFVELAFPECSHVHVMHDSYDYTAFDGKPLGFFSLLLPLELCEIKVQNMTSTFTHHRGRRDKVKQIGTVGLC